MDYLGYNIYIYVYIYIYIWYIDILVFFSFPDILRIFWCLKIVNFSLVYICVES